jgi:hypothetical protein
LSTDATSRRRPSSSHTSSPREVASSQKLGEQI